MEIVFLGTGTSQGVPMIAHDSKGLDLEDKRNWRTRTSAHVIMGSHHIQIDAAPELRLQCIQNRIEKVDTFILTHGHADHIAGMDDLRRFIDLRDGRALPVYSTEAGLGRVRAIFPYAIGDRPASRGYPAFKLHEMPSVLELPGGTVKKCLLPHGNVDVLGLVFEENATGKRLAYFTDCKRVPEEGRALAHEADLIVLDALRPMEHPTHMTIDEALATAADLEGKATYFTHMTYMVDHDRFSAVLPPKVELAYDGLRVVL
jgi:phosphoribosyl 1,2-cyclic phosphate phosphodiesterase|tara:strand:- start:1217 stop:1996 length:780 start_codon:yes stop_codon:yes gene_type:complete